jgi:hypothetical protein
VTVTTAATPDKTVLEFATTTTRTRWGQLTHRPLSLSHASALPRARAEAPDHIAILGIVVIGHSTIVVGYDWDTQRTMGSVARPGTLTWNVDPDAQFHSRPGFLAAQHHVAIMARLAGRQIGTPTYRYETRGGRRHPHVVGHCTGYRARRN